MKVDRSTGHLRVHRVVAVDDIGRVINPLLAEGQVVGGTAQGLGQALVEEVVHDAAGRQRTASFADYALLMAADMPPVETEFLAPSAPHGDGVARNSVSTGGMSAAMSSA